MKIAIIGSGISGLGAAYLLHRDHEVVVYEASNSLGGHSRTVDATIDGVSVPVDTGFIVFNKRNYPHLTGLFDHIGVDYAESDMSFGVSIGGGAYEYGTRKLWDVFAQTTNIFSGSHLRMLRDILRFNQQAKAYLKAPLECTLKDCLDEMSMGEGFRQNYLLAMGAAIWSTPAAAMESFPARTFLQFFDNHGLLSVDDQPQWYTVVGGSREYVKKLSQPLTENIFLSTPVSSVVRAEDGVWVEDTKGDKHRFDQVIFACHSDQALKILKTPSPEEEKVLSAIKYQPNRAVLHTDTSLMPKRKRAWSSWVYLAENAKAQRHGKISLTYWMNNLQPLNTDTPVLVTLNPATEPAADKLIDSHEFHHPVFDIPAIQAQEALKGLQGKDRLWFAGAYTRYGFHEDGLLSAVNVAQALGAKIPWL